ncbi:hypothetical protein LZ190_10535 [Rhodovulum sulfidophilum]|nr:hypothetical protein [Rhodovulum sulfidophilum]
MSGKVIGKRFSHVYLVRGEPERDSKKARFRLAKLAERSCPPAKPLRHGSSVDYNKNAQEKIENELGVRFGTQSTAGALIRSWDWYFNKVTVTEMLDTITVVAASLHNQYTNDDKRGRFLSEARRILKEENLAYEIDEIGGVHPLVDATFSVAMETAISGMDTPRYAASAEFINRIDGYLLQNPQDFIGAIRAVFGACENTFKLMYEAPRLDARAAGERIGGDQQRLYAEHPTLQAASAKMLEAFKQWVNAAHFYRHEQGVEEPNQPAPEVAILLISQGLSFARWLTVLDRKKDKY